MNKRLHFLSQLKRAKVKYKGLALLYTSCIRFAADYVMLAFYYSLPQYLKINQIRLEKTNFGYIVMLRARIFRSLIPVLMIKERNIRARNITI